MGHPFLHQEHMGVHEEQGGGFSCWEGCVRACCQWQLQLSKKRDFFPSMVPVSMCHTALVTEIKGRGTRHAQDSSRVLGMIAEPTGTDGQRAFGRSPRPISSRSPLAGVLFSLQSPANSGHAPVSRADPPPLPVSPPHNQGRPGPDTPRRGIPLEQWPDVLRRIEQGESLRQVAQSYSVSYETIRRIVRAMRRQATEGQR
jgi:hypothetical protein